MALADLRNQLLGFIDKALFNPFKRLNTPATTIWLSHPQCAISLYGKRHEDGERWGAVTSQLIQLHDNFLQAVRHMACKKWLGSTWARSTLRLLLGYDYLHRTYALALLKNGMNRNDVSIHPALLSSLKLAPPLTYAFATKNQSSLMIFWGAVRLKRSSNCVRPIHKETYQ